MRKISNLEIYSYLWLLSLLLIILKVTNILNIDWVFVFAPLWMPIFIIVLIVFLILITSIISTIIYRRKKNG